MQGILYPEWHANPLLLSREEMEDPYIVFDQFFQFHTLTRTRAVLRHWLVEYLHVDQDDAPYMVTHCEELIRLTEAAWVILSKQQSNIAKEDKPSRTKKAIPKTATSRRKKKAKKG